jgi:hypothetical protein
VASPNPGGEEEDGGDEACAGGGGSVLSDPRQLVGPHHGGDTRETAWEEGGGVGEVPRSSHDGMQGRITPAAHGSSHNSPAAHAELERGNR